LDVVTDKIRTFGVVGSVSLNNGDDPRAPGRIDLCADFEPRLIIEVSNKNSGVELLLEVDLHFRAELEVASRLEREHTGRHDKTIGARVSKQVITGARSECDGAPLELMNIRVILASRAERIWKGGDANAGHGVTSRCRDV